MARTKDKYRAITLRKSGKSYSEIKDLLGVAKSTLSAWLKEYPLSAEKIRELRDWNPRRIEKYRNTRKRQREAMLKAVYDAEKKEIMQLSDRDLFIGGLFLYWGEGGKTKPTELAISNTNPAIIRTGILWMTKCLGADKNKIRIKLHLYKDMNARREIRYWSRLLGMPPRFFRKPYIKQSKLSTINYKVGYGHGTCNLLLSNAILAKKVLMGIKVLEDYFLGA